MSVVRSVLLHGTVFWAGSLCVANHRKRMAAQVCPPVRLQPTHRAMEWRSLSEQEVDPGSKCDPKETVRWEPGPGFGPWLGRSQGEIDFYMAQLFT